MRQLADWTSRGLVNSANWHRQIADVDVVKHSNQSRAVSVSVFKVGIGFWCFGRFLKVGVGIGLGLGFFKYRDIGFGFFHMNILCLTVSQLSLLGRSKTYL